MHSKKFTKTERRGLPGGPNEMFTYVTGVFSTEGYKNGSPDINNPFNIIPSGKITMKDVDFPVIGIDNLGNKKRMMPGGEYEFPGDTVFEIPIKALPKAQGGNKETFLKGIDSRTATLSAYEEPSWYEKAADIMANPMTAFGFSARGQDIPDRLNVNNSERNAYDSVIDMINPFAWKQYAENASRDIEKGEYLDASLNSLGAIPIIPAWLKNLKGPIKSLLPQLKNPAIKSTDDVVEMVEDLFGNKIKKADAERFFRIEDANVNAKTYVDPKTNIRSYESGNWVTNNADDALYYTNHTAKAGVPRGVGNMLSTKDPRRLITGYMDKETAKLFNAPNSTAIARDLSGGTGNAALQREFIIPPTIMDNLRSKAPNNMFRNDIFLAVDNLYKMYGGDLPKAQRGFFTTRTPKSEERTPQEKYYNPEVEENITTGDWRQDLLYNNQWLMNTPILGDYIKDKARKIAEMNAGERRDAYDLKILEDPDSNYNQRKDKEPRYTGWSSSLDNAENKNQVSLMDQYFSEEALFPVSPYKPKSDYLEFLPSYSIKKRVDSPGRYQDRRDQGLELTIRDAFKKFTGQDGTDTEYTFEDITKSKEFTEFLKNKKTIFMTNDYDKGSYLSDALGLDLGGHKTGIAWDEEVNLPYISISDAWDFSPDHYSDKWSGTEEERQTSKIQASLMHKAGKPFKIYDRFYFDPKSQITGRGASGIKYYTDKEIEQIRSKNEYEKKAGGSVSWNWKGKSYSGTLIPSMENENNRYARTKNGKIKTLPKKKMGGKLRIYKDFIDGKYDKSPRIDFVQSVYDRVNNMYKDQAKEANMSVPNFVMTFLQDA